MSTRGMRPDAGAVYRRYLSAVLLHGQASAREGRPSYTTGGIGVSGSRSLPQS